VSRSDEPITDIDILDAILIKEKHVMRWSFSKGEYCDVCGWVNNGTQGQAWMRRDVCPGKMMRK
jgi:hypothetical protein